MVSFFSFIQIQLKRVDVYVHLLISHCICTFFKVRRGRVLFWSTVGKDYSCNPLYISNYILNHESETFEVYWMFRKKVDTSQVDNRIKKIVFGTLKYLYVLHTAEFIITNHRTPTKEMFWLKRSEQKYVMTWHGSMPLKMIEKDADSSHSKGYILCARNDSKICDLMLSDSQWYTNLIRRAFEYNGPILEKGMPRNDILFDKEMHHTIKYKVAKELNIQDYQNKYIVLYAPTFRTNHRTDYYILKWKKIVNAISYKLKKDVVILMRLHPTLLEEVDTSNLITEPFVINASKYNNMQELMITSDLLITDYSSTMFEFCLLDKPCFLYTPDFESYDRGTYFSLKKLPFGIAYTIEEIIDIICNCDEESYVKEQHVFLNETFQLYENKCASMAVVEWMKQQLKSS